MFSASWPYWALLQCVDAMLTENYLHVGHIEASQQTLGEIGSNATFNRRGNNFIIKAQAKTTHGPCKTCSVITLSGRRCFWWQADKAGNSLTEDDITESLDGQRLAHAINPQIQSVLGKSSKSYSFPTTATVGWKFSYSQTFRWEVLRREQRRTLEWAQNKVSKKRNNKPTKIKI